MRIFLIGFMGSGKTTLGKRLAVHYQYQFIDLDKEIEAEIGMCIPQYFEKFGEAKFRDIESAILKQAEKWDNAIIATGGGAPCYFDNIDWMNAKGITVYLSLSPKALVKRLENGTDQRPVLQGLKGSQLEAFIAEKLAARDVFYKQAQLEISGINLTAAQLAARLDEYHRK